MRSSPRHLRAVVLAVALSFAAVPSQAWIATEITQVMNNIELVAEYRKQVETVAQLVKTYQTQYLQLQEQLRAGFAIPGVALADVLRIKQDIDNYESSLKGLGRDLKSLGTVYDTRMSEAKLLNVSFADYLQREQQRISQGNAAAKFRVEREAQIMDQVRQDIALAKRYGDQVSSTTGVHAAMGLMNQQGNLMAQQLNKLVMMTAEAQGSDKANQEAERAAEEAAALARRQALRSTQSGIDARNDSMIHSALCAICGHSRSMSSRFPVRENTSAT